MKGYIAHAQQIVVLSKDRPFPWSVAGRFEPLRFSLRSMG